MITVVTYERVTYSVFDRFSKKRTVWIMLSIICLIVITVVVVAAIVYFQHKHMSKNASTTQPAPTRPFETTTNGLWQSLSSDFTSSTFRQSSVVAIETIKLVTTNGGSSREYTTFVTHRIAEPLRTTEISESTGVIYTVETLRTGTFDSDLQASGITTTSQGSTSIELTTAVLTATLTEASSRLTSPIAQMPGRAPPTSDTFTTLASDTSVPGSSTVDMTFLSIPTALLGNKSKIKSILAHIDRAASDPAAEH